MAQEYEIRACYIGSSCRPLVPVETPDTRFSSQLLHAGGLGMPRHELFLYIAPPQAAEPPVRALCELAEWWCGLWIVLVPCSAL